MPFGTTCYFTGLQRSFQFELRTLMDLQAAKKILYIVSGGIGGNVSPLLNDTDESFHVA